MSGQYLLGGRCVIGGWRLIGGQHLLDGQRLLVGRRLPGTTQTGEGVSNGRQRGTWGEYVGLQGVHIIAFE